MQVEVIGIQKTKKPELYMLHCTTIDKRIDGYRCLVALGRSHNLGDFIDVNIKCESGEYKYYERKI